MASDEKPESRYKTLVVPEFKSSIPPHVLAKLPESERYLVEIASKLEDQSKWLTGAVKSSNEADIEMDIRVAKVEKFNERLTSKWAIFSYLAAAALPVGIKLLLEHWIKP